jgi:hypothetical protein
MPKLFGGYMASASREALHQLVDNVDDAVIPALERILAAVPSLSQRELEHLSLIVGDFREREFLRRLSEYQGPKTSGETTAAGRENSSESLPMRGLNRAMSEGDQVALFLASTPYDDEPSSPEEDAAAEAAWQQYLRGEARPWDQVRQDLAGER